MTTDRIEEEEVGSKKFQVVTQIISNQRIYTLTLYISVNLEKITYNSLHTTHNDYKSKKVVNTL